jgi:prephenate dehydratase
MGRIDLRVGYEGEPGAFSEEAVRLLLPRAEPVPVPTFRRVFEAVESGELDRGVVPLENSQAGSINETYDLLARPGLTGITSRRPPWPCRRSGSTRSSSR